MKNIIIIFLLLLTYQSYSQQFINSGVIEYEVKTNVHRQNEKNEWFERWKDQIPKFTTNYYSYTFSGNKAVYKFDRREDTRKRSFWDDSEENLWYNDYTARTFTNLKVIDGYSLISGDLRNIKWKIHPDDQRTIAGFNCRLAQTVLFDSVYIFVYYTDEIKISGGPMGLNGLPGMIMGVTIPRLYTSWMATGVKLNVPDASIIKAPTRGKKTTTEQIRKGITDLAKSWGGDSKSWIDQMLWQFLM